MITDAQRQDLEKVTGVPATLLTGDTIEENLALAKALNAYKDSMQAQEPTTPAGKFAAWFNANYTGNSDYIIAGLEEEARKHGTKN